MSPFARPSLLRRYTSYSKNSLRQISNNFVETAGFGPATQAKEYGNKKLLLLADGSHLTYNDVNVASGRYAAMLNRQFGVKVREVGKFLKLCWIFRNATLSSAEPPKPRTRWPCIWAFFGLVPPMCR